MKGETGMLKLEIKLDEEKIRREGKYTVESIYRAVDKPFQDFHLLKVVETDGTRNLPWHWKSRGLWGIWSDYNYIL